MKNDDMQRMGVTPWLGDTRVQNKGGKAAKRTLTDLCREARAVRDECRSLRDEAAHVLGSCVKEREVMEKLNEDLAKKLRRDAVFGVCWTAAGVLVCVGFWIWG